MPSASLVRLRAKQGMLAVIAGCGMQAHAPPPSRRLADDSEYASLSLNDGRLDYQVWKVRQVLVAPILITAGLQAHVAGKTSQVSFFPKELTANEPGSQKLHMIPSHQSRHMATKDGEMETRPAHVQAPDFARETDMRT